MVLLQLWMLQVTEQIQIVRDTRNSREQISYLKQQNILVWSVSKDSIVYFLFSVFDRCGCDKHLGNYEK